MFDAVATVLDAVAVVCIGPSGANILKKSVVILFFFGKMKHYSVYGDDIPIYYP